MRDCIIPPRRGNGIRFCNARDLRLALFLALVLEANFIQPAQGWKRGLQRSGWLSCRGGSSSQPSNYNQASYGDNLPPPDLPPDLPPLEGEDSQSAYHGQNQSHDPYSYQGDPLYDNSREPTIPRNHPQHQVPPPLPQGYSDGQPPFGYGPPGMQEPSLVETNEETAMGESWGDTGNDSGLDLSSLNKEYILRGLAKLYKKKILPLELSSGFGHFNSPPLSPSDFVAPPMVLLLGQYRYGVGVLRLAQPLLIELYSLFCSPAWERHLSSSIYWDEIFLESEWVRNQQRIDSHQFFGVQMTRLFQGLHCVHNKIGRSQD